MRGTISVTGAGLALAALFAAAPSAIGAEPAGYRLVSEMKLPGAVAGWDYLSFDEQNRRLFISRRTLGEFVYAPDTNEVTGPIKDSQGTNGVALAPDLGRGYTSNGDGTSTVFDLKTLATIDRVKVAEDNDANIYDPATHRVVFINGDSGTATFLDARDNKVAGTVALDSRKPEFPAVDGHGHLYDAIQDKNEIAVIDTAAMKQIARWPTGACTMPTATRMDVADHRLFVGCRGNAPVFAAIDTDSGKIVATLPIGRGADAVNYDRDSRTIIISNGLDSNFVVIRQNSADDYALVETVYTRPYARTSALDPRTRKLYLVTAEFSVEGAVFDLKKMRFRPDSFTLLTYAP